MIIRDFSDAPQLEVLQSVFWMTLGHLVSVTGMKFTVCYRQWGTDWHGSRHMWLMKLWLKVGRHYRVWQISTVDLLLSVSYTHIYIVESHASGTPVFAVSPKLLWWCVSFWYWFIFSLIRKQWGSGWCWPQTRANRLTHRMNSVNQVSLTRC